MSVLELPDLKKICAEHPRYRERVLPAEVESTVAIEEPTAVREYYEGINDAIALEKADRLRFGFEPKFWAKTDEELRKFRAENPVGVVLFVVLGGKRSSKTEWRSKRTVENMLANLDYKVWASHSTQESSREAQQTKLHEYIPAEYKSEKGRMRIGAQLKVNYTPWAGFTENVFAFPSDKGGVSECRFKFYSMDPRSLEGAEINEGWLDEQAEMEWVNAYIGRCMSRNGIVFLTFAAISGYTQLVKSILAGSKTLEWEEAKLLPVTKGVDPSLPFDQGGRMVPRVQQNDNMVIQSGEDGATRLKVKARIVYFHASDNPYGNPSAIEATLQGATRDKILMDFYGVPTKSIAAQFSYVDSIHTLKVKDYQALVVKLGNRGTRYLLIDPCPGRNWFMTWIWFWAPSRAIIYREWPTTGHMGAHIEGIGDPGAWSIPGKSPDGAKGEAQTPFGFGYARYTEEIAKCEGWWRGNLKESIAHQRDGGERIYERYVDGRYAVSPTQTREGKTTWIEQMEIIGLKFVAEASEQKILSGESDGSIEMINEALAYDKTVPIGELSPTLARINEPELMVLETCVNTIFSLQTWTGLDGQHGKCKDPLDNVRGCYLSELDYVDESKFRPHVPMMERRR